jgi:type III pantothenate kinase
MNLSIDIGNTRTKLAIFDNGSIVESFILNEINIFDINKLTTKHSGIQNVILSSTKKNNKNLDHYLQTNFLNFIELSSDTKIPIENLYETKETLGKDRLAAVVGANNIFPETNVLVIDMGTAITYDFINNKAQYVGGTISPGMEIRYKSLNQFTEKLPLLERQEDFQLIGKNTDDAIISGVQSGITFETDSYINHFKDEYENLITILTGGDAIFFDKKLKNAIFVNLNLNLIGLNTILDYNIKK